MVPASQEPEAGMPEQQGKMPSEEQVGEKKAFTVNFLRIHMFIVTVVI